MSEPVRRAVIGRRGARILRSTLCVASLLVTAVCGARRVPLPTDPGSPLPNYSEIHAGITSACRGARTLTAEIGLRGRAGGRRLSGRLVAGFERPSSMHLSAVAPFGPPAFILSAQGDTAVLLLPRDGRVVRDESAEAILGALTGVSLAPADLHALLTGCVVPSPQAIDGHLHPNGWASIELSGGETIYLRRAGEWQIRAARRDGWQVEYLVWQGAFPHTIRLRSDAGSIDVEMTATLTQIEVNVDIDPAAFTIDVPASARPLTLDELRDAGPLGERE